VISLHDLFTRLQLSCLSLIYRCSWRMLSGIQSHTQSTLAAKQSPPLTLYTHWRGKDVPCTALAVKHFSLSTFKPQMVLFQHHLWRILCASSLLVQHQGLVSDTTPIIEQHGAYSRLADKLAQCNLCLVRQDWWNMPSCWQFKDYAVLDHSLYSQLYRNILQQAYC